MFPSVIVGGHAAAAPAAKSGDHNDIMIIMLMMLNARRTALLTARRPTDQNYCLRPNIFEESHIYTDNLINPCNYLTKTSY